ncbi:hypothetical protein OSB04_un000048 [Centaurea solstitialis]|uniref:Tf2-1-like SH3-like domain-containing protein n=1 Tax=Centaurea solstitialis TaxID=347529 RepID=A0AA38S501_9ASTR|nr:hypothetical protein OSB04_un000048 [Centaurea solstitialis]
MEASKSSVMFSRHRKDDCSGKCDVKSELVEVIVEQADDRRRPYLEFQVGDNVLLEVSLWKRVIRFRKRGKLGPRFIRPFTVPARMGRVAYHLELPEVFDLSRSTFHVSQLSKCLAGESAHLPLDDIQVGESLNYVGRPVAVLERRMKGLRNKELGIEKVQWQHRKGSE